ncbi:toprim domain-containing protein [Halorhodospira halophila]|uniref:toprim domain-containing protein n=1 Tax=Halorhodospira halophila TaxID=1053 RepID=UPI0019132D79|nr:toprim domain-containing protein [Halorhodospira halophila]
MERENARLGAGAGGRYVPNSIPAQAVDAIAAAMAADGIAPAHGVATLVADGKLHRYRVDGDEAGSCAGWYVIHLDDIPAAAYGSWKHRVSKTWRAPSPASAAQQQQNRQRMDTARRQREAKQTRRQQQAAAEAASLWARTRPADPTHPYLQAEGVPPLHARQLGDSLVLPLYDFDGRLNSLQFIYSDGSKRLLSGSRKRGCFIPVAGRAGTASRLLLCEEWATGASLRQLDPPTLVLAAVDANNLRPVAEGARRRWPRLPLVVYADADAQGERKARLAALAVGGHVAIPDVGDMNDAAQAARGEE